MTAPRDLLADVLRQVRVAGALSLRGEFSAPWVLLSPPRADLIQVLQPGARNLVLFHIVVQGHCRRGRRCRAFASAAAATAHRFCAATCAARNWQLGVAPSAWRDAGAQRSTYLG